MNIYAKCQQIQIDKAKLENLIDSTKQKLLFNIDKIDSIQREHKDFINFIKIIKIYELYRWTNLKYEYKNIKNTVTKDKKHYYIISKLYSNIISYYSEIEINNINLTIKFIKENTDLMLYNFNFLKRQHADILNTCKYLVKSDQFLKINEMNEDIKPIIIKLYKNYLDIKMTNKHYYKLKNYRLTLFNTK